MSALKLRINFALCVLACLLIGGVSVRAQENPAAKPRVDLAQMRLKNVEIERESIAGLFAALSFSYDIPIGLEIARGGDEVSLYQINFQKGTLSDLLTRFVAQYDVYDWKIEDGVVSVFPKKDYRDPLIRELLLTEIRSFAVEEKTSTMGFGNSLLSTREAKSLIESIGMNYDTGHIGGFYIQQLGQKFSFEVSNTRLKSILDKVIKESPVARNWTISTSAQTIFLRVNVKLEYTPEAPAERVDQLASLIAETLAQPVSSFSWSTFTTIQ